MTSSSGDFAILDTTIDPATRSIIQLDTSRIGGQQTSIEVINGRHPGPVLCLTAAIHGDELNGIEIIRQVTRQIDPETLGGVLVAIPVVNSEGYRLRSRYIGDHDDLNRCFPGDQDGTYPQQLAHTIFTDVIGCCEAVIDLHTGASGRENHPQLRVDLSLQENQLLSSGFNHISILQSNAPRGSLREASSNAGIAAIVMEIGSAQGLEPDKVLLGVAALQSLLGSMGMTAKQSVEPVDQHIYYGGGWVRAEIDGIFVTRVELGDEVEQGTAIADIVDPLSSATCVVFAPVNCTILSKSHNQFVSAGSGLFRVGIAQETTHKDVH